MVNPTIPTNVNTFSIFPSEVQQRILEYVGNPAATNLVLREWQGQTRAVVNSELLQVFQHLNPGQPFNLAIDLPAIKEIYRQTLRLVLPDIAPHLPRVSVERFIEAENAIKISSTLVFWSHLPGGEDHLTQQDFRDLPLADIRSQLRTWIEKNPAVKNMDYLNLSNSNLRYLPPEIGLLTNITGLYLNQNHLTALPSEIGQLTNLTYLVLSENHLTALPPEIGLLKNLTYLSLGQNHLTELPPEIGQLMYLTGLVLNQNHLTELPPEIGQLTNLRVLVLEQNQLTALPDTLERSQLPIKLSQLENNSISAATAYRFFQLSLEQKNAVYGHIYDLAIGAGVIIEPRDTQYGESHVFDSQERLQQAMDRIG